MKKLTKTTCFLSALILCLGLCGCNSDDKDSSKVESIVETTEQETTEAPQDTIPSTQETTHNFSNEATIVQFIQSSLENAFNKDDITIEYDKNSNSYIAHTYHEDLVSSIVFTKINTELENDWNGLVGAYTLTGQNIFEYIQECDSTANVILNLTTGKKEENTAVLTISNGEVTYNLYEYLNEKAEDSKPAY